MDKKYGKGGREEVRDLLLELWDALHISRTVLARNFKFGMQTDRRGTNANI